MRTVGEALIDYLEARHTQYVFGIPGVHTVALYRALARSSIRHITPRHEQSAGFMADGYARVSGQPGVCLLITGPGLTNAITAMGQALADSIPMLVISGVNPDAKAGALSGRLHELPDQHGLMQKLLSHSWRLETPAELPELLAKAYAVFESTRPQPVHIEIPLDVMDQRMPDEPVPVCPAKTAHAAIEQAQIQRAADELHHAKAPQVLVGGGAVRCADLLKNVLERLDAPAISTANARACLGDHPLHVPASASLSEVRQAIATADVVLALGTEFGTTDYDVYEDGQFPPIQRLIRVDIDGDKLRTGPASQVAICAPVEAALNALASTLMPARRDGAQRTETLKQQAAKNPWVTGYQRVFEYLAAAHEALSDYALVGDSTQAMYAANLMHTYGVPQAWFNAATGYGTLGYAPGAAIGAALANPERPTLCWIGDGGMQFALADIGAAVDAAVPVIFVIWNNQGFQEIENFMHSKNVAPVGVTPSAPDFCLIARAYGVPSQRVESVLEFKQALQQMTLSEGPALIEISTP